jgi:hypothetical protein
LPHLGSPTSFDTGKQLSIKRPKLLQTHFRSAPSQPPLFSFMHASVAGRPRHRAMSMFVPVRSVTFMRCCAATVPAKRPKLRERRFIFKDAARGFQRARESNFTMHSTICFGLPKSVRVTCFNETWQDYCL